MWMYKDLEIKINLDCSENFVKTVENDFLQTTVNAKLSI